MIIKLACSLLIGGFVVGVSAQTTSNIQAPKPYSAYVQDSTGTIVRSQSGLCWHTGYWTKADSLVGCDGELTPPVTKSIAPAFVAAPDPAPANTPALVAAPTPPIAAPAPVAKPAPVSEKVNLAGDALFASGKAELSAAGKAKLDDLTSKLNGMKLEVIVATGYTDSQGSAASNLKLSIKRANAVKTYLTSKGVEANRIYAEGKGETKPIASNKTAAGRAQNRRVEIEIVGSRTK